MNNNYYVFGYFRSKNSKHENKGMPYYIGVGKNQSRFANQFMIGRPPYENNIIMADKLTKKTAYELQKELISKFGRLDLGTGCLRNRSAGGFTSGKQISEEINKRLNKKG